MASSSRFLPVIPFKLSVFGLYLFAYGYTYSVLWMQMFLYSIAWSSWVCLLAFWLDFAFFFSTHLNAVYVVVLLLQLTSVLA